MSKKKSPNKGPAAAPKTPDARPPVVHGDCFRTFITEAQSIGNEVEARRVYDADVVEYLQAKGLFEEWSAWREAKRAPVVGARPL